MHPLQGASFLSTPLQGGILKPPALRVVDDLRKVNDDCDNQPLPLLWLRILSY